jgi:hypothetical protein
MTLSYPPQPTDNTQYNENFLEYIKLFVETNAVAMLFPRECRVCGTTFADLVEYCCATSPRAHCFEDCRGLGAAPFMMLYRHCTCGNTLVLSITEKAFPWLNTFWEMLQEEAEESKRSLKAVVADFAKQFETYLLSLNSSGKKPTE